MQITKITRAHRSGVHHALMLTHMYTVRKCVPELSLEKLLSLGADDNPYGASTLDHAQWQAGFNDKVQACLNS